MADHAGFLGFSDCRAGKPRPRVVIFGAPHGTPYPGADTCAFADAAAAIRAASQEDAYLLDSWDFDLGGPLLDGCAEGCVDVGDLPTMTDDGARNRKLIEAKTREILAASAVPLMIGGDDSVPIPFFAGFSASGPIWILQIDAHIDWRDERFGEEFGYSSTMRRASEMPHVAGIVQVGIRGLGSARVEEVDAARHWGSHIVTAREIHAGGIHTAMQHIPQGARVVITLDCDGLDPSVMPGVAARSPGGLTYTQVIDLLAAVSSHGSIVGFDIIEFHAASDLGGLTAITAARILANAIGRIVRQTWTERAP
jgi:agmatinase